MNILIIGGTKFLGRAIAENALVRGHRLTLFHRGVTQPDLFPQVEHLLGDRNADLSALRGRTWDAVIDPSAYFPRQVSRLIEFLQEDGAQPHYTFISSLSVYATTHRAGIDESGAVGTLLDSNVEIVTDVTYGPLKALCERAAAQALPGHVLTLRPGLIVGPHDPTDRFTYWPYRIRRGGEVLAPGRPDRLIQFIDVRDLAEWTLRMVEVGQTGVFNANSPAGAISMEALLLTCKQVTNRPARLIWASDAFLEQQQVGAWVEMPLWIPESDPDAAGFFTISVEKAITAGLTFRPLADTIRATLDWADTRPPAYEWNAGLSPQREVELLERLRHARR